MKSDVSPAKQELKNYEEVRKSFGINPSNAPLFHIVALHVYTCAFKGVKSGMEENIKEIEVGKQISSDDLLVLHNGKEVLEVYEKILRDLSDKARKARQKWHKANPDSDELSTAFENFLSISPTFSYKDLIAHMEAFYSEKKLVKYIGTVPLHKDVLKFTETAVERKLKELSEQGIVLSGSGSSVKSGAKAAFPEEHAPKLKLDVKYVSLPFLYNLFCWQWDPTAYQPAFDYELREVEHAMEEILGCDLASLQTSKVLKLIFKDCESDKTKVASNYAKILSLYYKQIGEHAPDFLETDGENASFKLGRNFAKPEQATLKDEY
ncbi:hypothetical protein HY992_00480 [Candidatus Micrarchaeota archaeon]|nr:hypothetical protein [Candidatus Micrarchaeota archaeon]